MEILIRKRYKIVRTIREESEYALFEAVDIVDRETPMRLLNRYEGEKIHIYARIYALMQTSECPAFHEVFFDEGRLFAVFDTAAGKTLEQVFFKKDGRSWQEHMDYAEKVLHQALMLSNLPTEISTAAMQRDNVLADIDEGKVNLRYMIRPLNNSGSDSLALLARDRVRQILVLQLSSGKTEAGLIRRLDEGGFRSAAALYGVFKDARPLIEEERAKFEKMSIVRKGLIILARAVLRRTKWGDRV